MPMFRYYKHEYSFLIDFNVILAHDFQSLYQKIAESFYKIDPNNSYYFEIVKEIESLH